MNLERQEVRTGLLVIVTVALFVAVIIYLGSPGVFQSQKTFRVFFDDASGIKPGAQVTLAGRKIGLVHRLYSPVPEKDRPTPKLEVLIEVRVEAAAPIYRRVKVSMAQPKLLGEPIIDFSNGEEASGWAPDGHYFVGERAKGLADAVPAVLEKLTPVLEKATATLESLQKTADNLSNITKDGGDLTVAFSEFRDFGKNLNQIAGDDGPLRQTLTNVQGLTGAHGKLSHALDNLNTLIGPDGSLASTLGNAERFTANLVNNRDLEVTLKNFRRTSESLNATTAELGVQFAEVGVNLQQASDTVKHQPWRLIWPTTKHYNDPNSRERVREEAARIPTRRR